MENKDKIFERDFPLGDDLKFRSAVINLLSEILGNQEGMQRMIMRMASKTMGEDYDSLVAEYVKHKADAMFGFMDSVKENL